MSSGFDKLEVVSWSTAHQAIINAAFKGKATQWRGKNLKMVRTALRKEILDLQRYCCEYCRRKIGLAQGSHQIDHIIPTSTHPQFTYTRINLVATCVRCNRIKKHHDPRWVKTTIATSYPTMINSWKWIHPYFHSYAAHLKIKDSLIFVIVPAVGPARQRAEAVIKHCGLNSIRSVEIRAAAETFKAGKDLYEKLLGMIWMHRALSDIELARLIKRLLGLKNGLVEISNYVKDMRAGGLTTAESLVKKKFKF